MRRYYVDDQDMEYVNFALHIIMHIPRMCRVSREGVGGRGSGGGGGGRGEVTLIGPREASP